MTECTHPPTRLYTWTAFDGTFCIACCECGAALKGAITEEEKMEISIGGKAMQADYCAEAITDARGNELVVEASGCPMCQERRMDYLEWSEDGEYVECQTCYHCYDPA